MFKIPRPNVIESDEGFSVEVIGRTGLLYTEGTKILHVDSKVLAGLADLGIYQNSIKSWDATYQHELIDENKRAAIVDNTRRVFHFRGVEIEVL